MRVLHVTSTFPRTDGDPTGPFIADLVAAEQAAGLEVRVVAPHAAGLPIDDSVGGVEVRRFRYGPGAAEVLAYRGGLLAAARSPGGAAMVGPYIASMGVVARREVTRWRPDVVHAHWWFPGGVVAAGVSGAVPVVVTVHGSDVGLAGRRPWASLARWVAGRAASVVAVSDALAAEAGAILRVPVGVARMPVVVVGPPSRGGAAERDGARLVAAGRLTPEKGFDVLVEALGRPGAPRLGLDIVGGGPSHDALAAAARRVGADVDLVGPLARADLHARMAGAAAVVVPSRREGLGLVAVEAVLLGTPVVASAVGGLPGVLGAPAGVSVRSGEVLDAAGGLLVPPADPAALAAALLRVPSLPSPGPAAVAAAERHRPAAVVECHLDLYERAADRGRAIGGR